jgi:hypothetical protein
MLLLFMVFILCLSLLTILDPLSENLTKQTPKQLTELSMLILKIITSSSVSVFGIFLMAKATQIYVNGRKKADLHLARFAGRSRGGEAEPGRFRPCGAAPRHSVSDKIKHVEDGSLRTGICHCLRFGRPGCYLHCEKEKNERDEPHTPFRVLMFCHIE